MLTIAEHKFDLTYQNIRVGRLLIGVAAALCQTFFYQILNNYNVERLYDNSQLWDVSIALDQYIPLIPEFAWIYFCYIPALIIPAVLDIPFRVFIRYAFGLTLCIVVSCVCFYLLPIKMVHDNSFDCQQLSCSALVFLRSLDSGVNIMPSLHTSQSLLAIFALITAKLSWRGFSVGVILASLLYVPIIASTLLTHQHYIVDIAAGAALAIISWQVALWLTNKSLSEQHD